MIARACWWRPPPGYGALHAPDRQPLTEERRSAGDVPEKVQVLPMIRQYLNVMVDGSPSDVHVRTEQYAIGTDPGFAAPTSTVIRFCGVYVRPVGAVPGYWYFPEGDRAQAALAALPVRS